MENVFLGLQRRICTPALWTSSPDAKDTQSKFYSSRKSFCSFLLLFTFQLWTIINQQRNQLLNKLSTVCFPGSWKVTSMETCSCPTEACFRMLEMQWTTFMIRWINNIFIDDHTVFFLRKCCNMCLYFVYVLNVICVCCVGNPERTNYKEFGEICGARCEFTVLN